jgi:uncharacterized YigZ family protein
MNAPDHYLTAATEAVVETKVKGSRFIGQLYLCGNENRAREILESTRKKYYDATHNCYAWKVGLDKDVQFKYSDDGEPGGTAGKPIYDQLEGAGLTDVIVIVTRYFGGTKLGTGGLTHAYSDCAAEVIRKAGTVEEFITDRFDVVLDFADYGAVERAALKAGAVIVQSDFSDRVALKIEIRLSRLEALKDKLVDITSGRIQID